MVAITRRARRSHRQASRFQASRVEAEAEASGQCCRNNARGWTRYLSRSSHWAPAKTATLLPPARTLTDPHVFIPGLPHLSHLVLVFGLESFDS